MKKTSVADTLTERPQQSKEGWVTEKVTQLAGVVI